ncbi:protein sprouty [Chrysoperla carnea]|uniref:protein sprouty n=1 Tax=Chrysoperla carnea TaxID=189513 RepID=UPI001D08E93B|nr:protein sprouty [Chrysoperla carnea]XP_044737335.1 protein sprouty [Chrysoperla carnea]
MAHNGGPRVPPRPPPASLAGVHNTTTTISTTRNIPPPPIPTGVHHTSSVGGNNGGGGGVVGHRAPAMMSVSLPPVTAPLSPLGSRHHQHPHPQHLHRLAPPLGSLPRRVSPVRNGGGSDTSAPQTVPTTPVTLTSPRPDGERVVNEYVETPFGRGNNNLNNGGGSYPSSPHQLGSHHDSTQLILNSNLSTSILSSSTILPHSTVVSNHNQHSTGTTTITKSPHLSQHQQHHHHRPETLPLPSTVITKQPQSATFTKNRTTDPLECHTTSLGGVGTVIRNSSGVNSGTPGILGGTPNSIGVGLPGGGSIICPECGRCRCESCQQPRPLPQWWVCDKKCLCSVDAVIDYTSCLCCVKGLYYHCSKDYELERDGDGVSCADEPCSCTPHRRMMRWGCLLALTTVLPCLLCYWPLRGCARGVELIYAKHSRTGCRCRPTSSNHHLHNTHHHTHSTSVLHHQQDTLTTPEKRLLDSSPDF